MNLDRSIQIAAQVRQNLDRSIQIRATSIFAKFSVSDFGGYRTANGSPKYQRTSFSQRLPVALP
jgi:hypothetical protein